MSGTQSDPTFTVDDKQARAQQGYYTLITVALVIYMLATFLSDWKSGGSYQKAAYGLTVVSVIGFTALALCQIFVH